MSRVRLKIDLAGTIGDAAWQRIRHFDEIQAAGYGEQYGSSGPCRHAPDQPHTRGEWRGAVIKLQTPLLAQYAVSHYLEQPGVLDADVE